MLRAVVITGVLLPGLLCSPSPMQVIRYFTPVLCFGSNMVNSLVLGGLLEGYVASVLLVWMNGLCSCSCLRASGCNLFFYLVWHLAFL